MFDNSTGYTFNLHFHGLNTPAALDGASSQVIFGDTTKIGPRFDIDFAEIHNNAATLWYHAHPMFMEGLFTYLGVYGMFHIRDDASAQVDQKFHYGDNYLMLAYQDLDLNPNGTLTDINFNTIVNRSCFGVINGVSCINWYADGTVPYVNSLTHTSTRPLLKLDILSSTFSFRTIYVGVMDRDKNIKPFHLVQTDTGLCNPTKQKMIDIPVASRVGILVDLRDFPDGICDLFVYNFDLTLLTGIVAPVEPIKSVSSKCVGSSCPRSIPVDQPKPQSHSYPIPSPASPVRGKFIELPRRSRGTSGDPGIVQWCGDLPVAVRTALYNQTDSEGHVEALV